MLHDKDMWPLEAMVFMINNLYSNSINALMVLGAPIHGLLASVPQWHTLKRAEIQGALDALLDRNART